MQTHSHNTCIHIGIHEGMCANMYTILHLYMYMCIYIYTHSCILIYIYIIQLYIYGDWEGERERDICRDRVVE